MTDRARRKELVSEYRETPPAAGVYRIVNSQNDRVLIASTSNLKSVRNKLEFAQSTNSPTVLDHRLIGPVRELGIHAFSFEVLEVLEHEPGQTRAQLLADLAALEQLWREKVDPASLY